MDGEAGTQQRKKNGQGEQNSRAKQELGGVRQGFFARSTKVLVFYKMTIRGGPFLIDGESFQSFCFVYLPPDNTRMLMAEHRSANSEHNDPQPTIFARGRIN